MTISEETLKKITGAPNDEVPEAGYRLAARELQRSILRKTRAQTSQQENTRGVAAFLATPTGEAAFGFVLASALELAPSQTLQDERKRLAYNLRVQAYEGLGDTLLHVAGFLNSEVDEAMHHALGGAPTGTAPTPSTKKE
jgi:hypothetical protein